MFEMLSQVIPKWAWPALMAVGMWFFITYFFIAPSIFGRVHKDINECVLQQVYANSDYKWNYALWVATFKFLPKPSQLRFKVLKKRVENNNECAS